MQVLFSAPYSGAVYQWFAECGPEFDPNVRPDLPTAPPGYYSHALRGSRKLRDVALASLVMFDQVLLASGDLPAPSSMIPWTRPWRTAEQSRVPSLGVTVVQNAIHAASQYIGDSVPDIARQPEVRSVFRRLHPDEWWFEITGAVSDAMLVREHHVPLICGRRRRKVINGLIRMQVISREMLLGSASPIGNLRWDPIRDGEGVSTALLSYQKLTALRLREPTLRRVADIKDDRSVRRVSDSFQALLAAPAPVRGEEELREAARAALRSRRLLGRLGGLVDINGLGFGLASVPPTSAFGFGPASLGVPLLKLPVAASAEQHSWVEFGPTVRHVAEVQRLRRTID